MKPLRLWFVDVSRDAISPLLDWLAERFTLEFTDRDPDFILHSCFGRDVLKFNGVRIGWYGENIQPDFNISDYAMGFGDLAFGERYRRIPLYRWYMREYDSLFEADRSVRRVDGAAELSAKSRFCTCVVSNGARGPYFRAVLARLQHYKQVDSGGRWANNVGGPVVDKIAFLRQGKFHLAFENSSTPGYVTEKIMHAFAARSVPVYWGAPDVVRDFNPKAFVNCHAMATVDDVVAAVRRLDEDDERLVAMLEQPCFAGGVEPASLQKRSIMDWLESIFEQPRDAAYRRNRQFWGVRYQDELQTAFFQPGRQATRMMLRPMIRRLRAARRLLK